MATTDLPNNVTYGKVVGQFIASVADTADANDLPDSVPMGGAITFTPSASIIRSTVLNPNPVTIIKTPIVAVLDADGYLCTPTTVDGVTRLVRGVVLVATDNPNLNPVGWTWSVSYRLTLGGRQVTSPSTHPINVPENSTQDLTLVGPVSASGGTSITRGESAYDVAVRNGFVGTEAQWLTTMRGRDGSNVLPTSQAIYEEVSFDGTPTNTYVKSLVGTGTGGGSGPSVPATTEFVEDSANAGFYLLTTEASVTEDPTNPGFYIPDPDTTIIEDPDNLGFFFVANPTSSGSTNNESILDLVGNAIRGTGLINVLVNDAADTITVSTMATQNSSDIALRDRASHTGTQTIATISGLQAALDTKGTSNLSLGLTANQAKPGNWVPTYADAIAGTTFTVTKTNGVWPGGTSSTWTRPTSRTDLIFVLRSTDTVFPSGVASGTNGYIIGVDELKTMTTGTTTPPQNTTTGFGQQAYGTSSFGG